MRRAETGRRIAASFASATASAVLVAGCGSGEGAFDFGDDEPDGYAVTMPDGFEHASPQRFKQLERQIEVGAETLADSDAEGISLEQFWLGEVDGMPVEIDIQTEELPADGVDLEQYDELAELALEQIPQIRSEGSEPYMEFDGEEASITDFDVRGIPLGAVSVATTVRDGFAYNVDVATSGPAERSAVRPLLDEIIGSWTWDE